jgi:hypothetical protein
VHLHSGHGGGLGDGKDEATRGEKKKMIAAQVELKKSSNTEVTDRTLTDVFLVSPHRAVNGTNENVPSVLIHPASAKGGSTRVC